MNVKLLQLLFNDQNEVDMLSIAKLGPQAFSMHQSY